MAKDSWNTVYEDDNIIVEKNGYEEYRISYFQDGHFKDEIIFTRDDTYYAGR